MKIIEGLKKVYSGKDTFSRHLSLFSICGIAGLLDVYATMEGVNSFGFPITALYMVLCLAFGLFITGYEIIFLKERELPDIDLNAFKILLNKPMLFVSLITCLMITTKIFPHFVRSAFIIEMLLAVPMTLVQAGISYNYNPEEALCLFKKLSIKDYFVLLFKRLALVLFGYLIVSAIIFLIFFLTGIVIAISQKGDMQSVGLIISSLQFTITKLSSFMAGILLVYTLTITTLVWDYELIKTFEKD